MIQSKLTAKAQTTIPQSVRTALRLRPGDAIAYRIEKDRVVMSRVESDAKDDPFKTFSEWDSEADRRAYAKL
jgi:antitoxin PrlF